MILALRALPNHAVGKKYFSAIHSDQSGGVIQIVIT